MLSRLKPFIAAGALAVAAFGVAMPAGAATFTSDNTCQLIDISPSADACWGKSVETPVNDSETFLNTNVFIGDGNDDLNVLGMFNVTDWAFAQKQEQSALQTTIDLGLVVGGVGATSGSWSLDSLALSAFEQVLFVLKAGPNLAAYLFDIPLAAASGTWATNALTGPQGKPQDLSHFSVYVRGSSVTPIPLPAGAVLLITGLVGLGVFGRRRKA